MQTGYITQWKLGGMVALIAPDHRSVRTSEPGSGALGANVTPSRLPTYSLPILIGLQCLG